ncbi:MAG: glycosyltransferase family 2 protein, partial [Lachnospiraceae bacterium]|nr:glycosyltransferase family 2 protein [Lachnospiraceae bacterium]
RTIDGNPLVSVIVKATDDDEALLKTVESIEQEGLPRYEVIVVQDASSFTESVDELVRKNPWHIRPFRFDEDLSLSKAYDAGLDMAQGEYVSFLRTGDEICHGRLKESVDLLEKEKSDLVICSDAVSKSTTVDGKTALTWFLAGDCYEKGTKNKVYRANCIHDHAVAFSDLPGEMEDDLFNLEVLSLAGSVSCIKDSFSKCACEEQESETTEEERFNAFIKGLEAFFAFCEANDLAKDSQELKEYAFRLFKEVEEDFAYLVREAEESDSLTDLFTKETRTVLAKIQGLFGYLLQKCLDRYEKEDVKKKVVFVKEADCHVPYTKYEGIAKNYEQTPILSIVLRIDDGQSLGLLETLVEEDPAAIECLVIDNTQDKASSEVLEEYADLYPNIRLWHMDKHAYQWQCMCLGAEEAKSEAVTYLRGTDEIDSEFVESTLSILSKEEKTDLIVFGLQGSDGVERDLSSLSEGVVSQKECVQAFFEQKMSFDCRGIVFERDLLQKNLLKKIPLFVDGNDELLLIALKDSQNVYLSQNGLVSAYDEISEGLIVLQNDHLNSFKNLLRL